MFYLGKEFVGIKIYCCNVNINFMKLFYTPMKMCPIWGNLMLFRIIILMHNLKSPSTFSLFSDAIFIINYKLFTGVFKFVFKIITGINFCLICSPITCAQNDNRIMFLVTPFVGPLNLLFGGSLKLYYEKSH